VRGQSVFFIFPGWPRLLRTPIMKQQHTRQKGTQCNILTCLQTNTTSETHVSLENLERALVPTLAKLVREGGGPLPTLGGYTCRLKIKGGYACYDIYFRRSKIISGVVAWNPGDEDSAWQLAQAASAAVGQLPIVMADESMKEIMTEEVKKPATLPWATSSLQPAALRPHRARRSKAFSLAVKTDQGLLITSPLTAATPHSLTDVARIEALLTCAILASGLGTAHEKQCAGENFSSAEACAEAVAESAGSRA